MLIHYTKYAEKKFDILNKYRVYITREQVEDAVREPEKQTKKGNCLAARRDGIKVVYDKKEGVIRVITFYPVKKLFG